MWLARVPGFLGVPHVTASANDEEPILLVNHAMENNEWGPLDEDKKEMHIGSVCLVGKGGATHLNVGVSLHLKKGVNTVKTLKFKKKWGVHDPPPAPMAEPPLLVSPTYFTVKT